MKIFKSIISAKGVKFEAKQGRQIAGRAYLYLLRNDLHKRPFGLLEDVFVDKKFRNQGLGSMLVTAVIKEAKRRKCYKLIATSRNTKPELKKFYAKFGLKVWGIEYRINF